MNAVIRFFLLALLALSPAAQALTAVFYQPQLRDRAVAEAEWPALFAGVRASGADTLVVQWTRHGEAFAAGDERAWLGRRLREARAAGLALVLGLHADPEAFAQLAQGDAALPAYFRRQLRANARLAQDWRNELGSDAIAGWYLPLEVDDRRWRAPAAREHLWRYLADESNVLGREGLPVYVSSFFAGYMAPAAYAELVADLQRTGVRLWVQDGAGTGVLTPAMRARYLAAVGDCAAAPAAGVVFELFRQTAPDATFAAEGAADASVRLAQRAPCGGDTLFFSLRYLPAAGGRLPVAP